MFAFLTAKKSDSDWVDVLLTAVTSRLACLLRRTTELSIELKSFIVMPEAVLTLFDDFMFRIFWKMCLLSGMLAEGNLNKSSVILLQNCYSCFRYKEFSIERGCMKFAFCCFRRPSSFFRFGKLVVRFVASLAWWAESMAVFKFIRSNLWIIWIWFERDTLKEFSGLLGLCWVCWVMSGLGESFFVFAFLEIWVSNASLSRFWD